MKLAQADRLLAEAGKFLEDNEAIISTQGLGGGGSGGSAKPLAPAVVIAGDFNSVPGSEGRAEGGSDGFGGGGRGTFIHPFVYRRHSLSTRIERTTENGPDSAKRGGCEWTRRPNERNETSLSETPTRPTGSSAFNHIVSKVPLS